MGWWETGNGDDVSGDGPADSVTGALITIAEACQEKNIQRPTLMQLLNGIVAALRPRPEVYLSDGEGISIGRLVAKLESHPYEVSVKEFTPTDEWLVIPLRYAFEEIAVEYQDSEVERKPRLSELLAAFAFVLGYEPEKYLSIGGENSVEEIVAELN